MKRNSLRRALAGLSVALWVFLFTGPAAASCGSANCFLVTGTQEGLMAPGQMVIDLSYRYIPQDRKQKGSSRTDVVEVPAINFDTGQIELPPTEGHEEISTINELGQLDVNYGITPNFGIAVAVPFSNNRPHEHIHLDTGDFSNSDGTSGMGDIAVTAKFALHTSTRHRLVGGAGVKLPTGEYKLRDSEGDITEPTLQPGTGSYDYLVSLFYDYQWQPHELDSFVSLLYRVNTENDLNYERGDAATLNTGVNYRVGSKMVVSGQINVQHADRDQFVGQDVPSTGNTMVYITPGIQVQSSDNLGLYSYLQLPLYQHVNEVNLVPRYGFMFGLSYAFSTL